MELTYTTINHPKSGETYAVAINAEGVIVKAAGPLHHADSTDRDSLWEWVNNADEAEADGEWLESELAKQS